MGDDERARSTALMTLSNPFGMFCSFLIQAFYSAKVHQDINDLGNPAISTPAWSTAY